MPACNEKRSRICFSHFSFRSGDSADPYFGVVGVIPAVEFKTAVAVAAVDATVAVDQKYCYECTYVHMDAGAYAPASFYTLLTIRLIMIK